MPATKHRQGLTVQELIDKLNQIQDKTKHVACPEMGLSFGITGVQNIIEAEVSGFAGAYSFEKENIVVIQI